MKTRLNKRREVYKNPFGGKKEKRHRARRFNVKHVSQAQFTGTRADGEERCQAAWPTAGGFVPPGKPYPARPGAPHPAAEQPRPGRGAPREPRSAQLAPPAHRARREGRGEPPCGGALPTREGQYSLVGKYPALRDTMLLDWLT